MFGFAERVTIRRPVGQMFNIAASPETRTTDLGLGARGTEGEGHG
jgi:hypothetical protein